MDYKKLYSDLIVELFIFLDNDSYIKIRDFIIKQGEQESKKQTKMKDKKLIFEALKGLNERLTTVEEWGKEPQPKTQKDFIIKELHKELDKKDHNISSYKTLLKEAEDIIGEKNKEIEKLKEDFSYQLLEDQNNKLVNKNKELKERLTIIDRELYRIMQLMFDKEND